MQQNSTLTVFSSGENFPINSINISLVNFGLQKKDANHHQGPVIKTEHVLQFITDGKGELIAHGKHYHVKAGDIFYLPKNVVLHYFSDKTDPYSYYWIGIDGASAKQLLERAGLCEENPVISVNAESFLPIFQKIFVSLKKNNLSGYVGANAAMFELFVQLLSIDSENQKTIKNVSVEYVEKAITFVQNNFGNDINVTTISDTIGLKRNYFCVIFKKYTGTSPVNYLMNYRINQARFMLSQGMRVTETAISCGFNSPANFSAQFKKLIGQTPFEYRKNTYEYSKLT